MRTICGKPLVLCAVDALREARIRTCVSTDCEHIAGTAERAGAEVVWRPSDLSGDTASSESAVLHAIDSLDWQGTYTLLVQCTTPLLQPEDVLAVAEKLKTHDCVFTVAPFDGFLWDKETNPVGHDPAYRKRRQDKDPQYVENGAVYGFRTEGFREVKNRFFGKLGTVPMPPQRSIEVDEVYHLFLLEAIVKKKLVSARWV